MTNELLTSAAAERNKDPILTILETVLPETGTVLEIASGTRPARVLLRRRTARNSLAAHRAGCGTSRSHRDAHPRSRPHQRRTPSRSTCTSRAGRWRRLTTPSCASTWSTSRRGPRRMRCCAAPRAICRRSANWCLYGPYLEDGTAVQSNLDFDASLKRRNPEWGLRELEEVDARRGPARPASPAGGAHAGQQPDGGVHEDAVAAAVPSFRGCG